MTDREKLIELLEAAHEDYYEHFDPDKPCLEAVAERLIANGVTVQQWIPVEDGKPKEFVSVIGHMTDAGDFPAVRECYLIGESFFFPALREVHPVDKWMPMPA